MLILESTSNSLLQRDEARGITASRRAESISKPEIQRNYRIHAQNISESVPHYHVHMTPLEIVVEELYGYLLVSTN